MREEDTSPDGGDDNQHRDTPEQRARRERNETVEELGEQSSAANNLFSCCKR